MDEAGEPQAPRTGPLGEARLAASGQGGTVNQFGVVGRDVTVFNLPSFQPRDPGPPHQTPSCDPCFHDRTEPLDRIDDAVLSRPSGSVRVIVVSGLPGVGRRAIARYWAQRTALARMFPGGELHIDFEDFRDRAGGDVSAALAECLRALGVDPEWIGSSLSELAARYRSVTFTKEPLLVVIENVTDTAQVRALMPNRPGSVVVVAGNRELGDLVVRDGAVPIRLEPLGADAGTELLACASGADRIGAEPAAAARLVDLCGGLPLAIRIAAGRLRLEPHLSVADYVRELEDEALRLAGFALGEDSVLALQLDQAFNRLPAAASALYRVLGLVPMRSFTVQLAAVAAALPERTAAATLRALRESSLLSQDDAGRYRFHDLVRLHARSMADERAEAGDERAVLHRVAEYVLPVAAFADRAVTGQRTRTYDLDRLVDALRDPFAASPQDPDAPGAARADALRWLDGERANLMALLRAAARDGTLDAETGQLAEMMTALFLNRRYLTDWIESGTLGAQAAARIGAVETEARLRSLTSRPLSDIGELERAGRELERALSLAERAGNLVLHASVWEFQGRYLNLVDPPSAAAAYTRSLELNTAAGEHRGAALAVFFLGVNQEHLGHREQALDTLRRARGLFRGLATPDERMAARAGLAVGRVLADLGLLEQAGEELRQAADALEALGALHYEARARELLGKLALDRGDPDEARRSMARALEIYEPTGDPRAEQVRAALARLSGDRPRSPQPNQGE